jgi:short subunit fatty acids transporter
MVKAIMKKRYGNNVPLDETVISPVNIFNSELLKTIKEHY